MKGKQILVLLLALCFVLSVPAALSEEADLDAESEAEIAEYETEDLAEDEADLEEIESESPVDTESVAEDLGLSEEDVGEYEEASARVGEKQYIYNKQLRHRLVVADITANAIMNHLEKKGEAVASLKRIQARIRTVKESLDPVTLTSEEFKAKITEIRGLTKQFKAEAGSKVTKEEVAGDIEEELEANKEQIKEVKEEEVRKLYNEKQVNKAVRNVVKEAKEMNKNKEKLMGVKERLGKLMEMKKRFLGVDATKENVVQFRQEWKTQLSQYKQEKLESKVKNERAKLLIEAKGINKAISEARNNGEDTTELEPKLDSIKAEIKEIGSDGIKSEQEIKAKANIVKNKLSNMKEDKKIKERITESVRVRVNSVGNSGSSSQGSSGSGGSSGGSSGQGGSTSSQGSSSGSGSSGSGGGGRG